MCNVEHTYSPHRPLTKQKQCYSSCHSPSLQPPIAPTQLQLHNRSSGVRVRPFLIRDSSVCVRVHAVVNPYQLLSARGYCACRHAHGLLLPTGDACELVHDKPSESESDSDTEGGPLWRCTCSRDAAHTAPACVESWARVAPHLSRAVAAAPADVARVVVDGIRSSYPLHLIAVPRQRRTRTRHTQHLRTAAAKGALQSTEHHHRHHHHDRQAQAVGATAATEAKTPVDTSASVESTGEASAGSAATSISAGAGARQSQSVSAQCTRGNSGHEPSANPERCALEVVQQQYRAAIASAAPHMTGFDVAAFMEGIKTAVEAGPMVDRYPHATALTSAFVTARQAKAHRSALPRFPWGVPAKHPHLLPSAHRTPAHGGPVRGSRSSGGRPQPPRGGARLRASLDKQQQQQQQQQSRRGQHLQRHPQQQQQQQQPQQPQQQQQQHQGVTATGARRKRALPAFVANILKAGLPTSRRAQARPSQAHPRARAGPPSTSSVSSPSSAVDADTDTDVAHTRAPLHLAHGQQQHGDSAVHNMHGGEVGHDAGAAAGGGSEEHDQALPSKRSKLACDAPVAPATGSSAAHLPSFRRPGVDTLTPPYDDEDTIKSLLQGRRCLAVRRCIRSANTHTHTRTQADAQMGRQGLARTHAHTHTRARTLALQQAFCPCLRLPGSGDCIDVRELTRRLVLFGVCVQQQVIT